MYHIWEYKYARMYVQIVLSAHYIALKGLGPGGGPSGSPAPLPTPSMWRCAHVFI
jgi:hypothetical protein